VDQQVVCNFKEMKNLLLSFMVCFLSVSITCGQNLEFNYIDIETFCSKYCDDPSVFWKGIGRTANYPKQCRDIKSSEKVEIILIYNKIDTNLRKFYFQDYNSCSQSKIQEIERVFIEHIKTTSESFILKFFIHFDLEPWFYHNSSNNFTHDGLLFEKETIVIKGYLPPIIKSGG